MKVYKLSELTQVLKGTLIGEDFEVSGINSLSLAQENQISFIDSLKRLPLAHTTKAKALLAPQGFSNHLKGKTLIEVENVRIALAKVSALFYDWEECFLKEPPLTLIDPSAEIHPSALIYPLVYIGKGVKIGKRVIIYPFCFIGDYCEIGEESILFPHVVLYPGTLIGAKSFIHSGVVLGADGFGYAQEPLEEGFRNLKIYHFGRVKIGDEVEIGANSTIDRAVFGETLIGSGTKIDNLVQIGHNVEIGKNCILVSHTAIGGSAVIEDYVILGGQVGVAPYSRIRKGAKVAGKSGVVGEIPPQAEVAGIPAIKANIWRRAVVLLEKLPEIYKKLQKTLTS